MNRLFAKILVDSPISHSLTDAFLCVLKNPLAERVVLTLHYALNSKSRRPHRKRDQNTALSPDGKILYKKLKNKIQTQENARQ